MKIENFEIWTENPKIIKIKDEEFDVSKMDFESTLILLQNEKLKKEITPIGINYTSFEEKDYNDLFRIISNTLKKPVEWIKENLSYGEIMALATEIVNNEFDRMNVYVKKKMEQNKMTIQVEKK